MNKRKAYRISIEPLRWEANDPLAAEHELVSRLVSETLKTGWQYYTELDLNLTDAGRKILAADPETAARIVLALVAHAATAAYTTLSTCSSPADTTPALVPK